MPQIKLPLLPDHQECEILTGLTVDNVPRDGNFVGRTRRHRKGGNVWKPDDRFGQHFFLHSGQIAIVSSTNALLYTPFILFGWRTKVLQK